MSEAPRADTNYALGSVLDHVLMHQRVIGMEAERRMDVAGDYPEIILLKTIIRDRKVYRDAMSEGLGVTEMNNAIHIAHSLRWLFVFICIGCNNFSKPQLKSRNVILWNLFVFCINVL